MWTGGKFPGLAARLLPGESCFFSMRLLSFSYLKTACEVYKIESRLEANEFMPGKFEYKKDCFRITPFTETVPTKDLCRGEWC